MANSSRPLVLLGESWGQNEERLKAGFVGAAGIELLKMLSEAEIISLTRTDYDYIGAFWRTSKPQNVDAIWRSHPELVRLNVFNFHPPSNRIESICGGKDTAIPGWPKLTSKGPGYLHQQFKGELDRLADDLVATDPNLIVCLGNTPLWAMAGTTGVSKLRGTTRISTHTVSGYKLLPTYHPAAILRQWELRPTTVTDLQKANREKDSPDIHRPEREVWIEPTLTDIEDFHVRCIVGCKRLAVDIETSGNQITCIGFSPSPRLALVVPFYDPRRADRNYWSSPADERHAWEAVRRILEDRRIHKVFQNGLYDIAFLWRSVGVKVLGATDDTMLLHHALQPESLKGLGFLGSIYSDEGAWKQERKTATIKRDE